MKIPWRATMWWLTGYSNGKSGEELANPQQLDALYQEDYDRGLNHGQQVRSQHEKHDAVAHRGAV